MFQAFEQMIEEKRRHDQWMRRKRQCTIRD